MAESAPQLPEDDIEAAPQQPVQDENAPADAHKRSHSDESPQLTYEQRLYNCVKLNNPIYSHLHGYLDFRDLSKMIIVHLMNELAKYDQATKKNKIAPGDFEHIGDLLHRYTTAIQDREYWSRLPKPGYARGGFFYYDLRQRFPGIYGDQEDLEVAHLGEVPKSTSGSIDPLRGFLKRVLPQRVTWTNDEFRRLPREYLAGKTPEELSPFVDTLARFIVAITGGLSRHSHASHALRRDIT